MSEAKTTVKIQSLLVGFSIIDVIVKHGKPIKFNEIHARTNITKSNLYKYLNTLISIGAIHRNKETGLYSPGSTLIQYGMAAVNQEDIVAKTAYYLEEINHTFGETTLLAVWTHGGPMIVKMIHSRAGLNLGGQVGTILPVHSAAGMLFAAYKKGPMIEEWIGKGIANLVPDERSNLREKLKAIQKEGISFAKDALAKSISSAAIPIFNYDRHLLGAVVIVGLGDTVPLRAEEESSRYLLQKSLEISAEFGYESGQSPAEES